MRVTADKLTFGVTMPDSARLSLIEGLWDTTSLLLANADKTKHVEKSLPYSAAAG